MLGTQARSAMRASLSFAQPFGRPFGSSTLVLGLALAPMAILAVFVVILLWVSFQRGMVGTPAAVYTLENYTTLFADPLAVQALVNTAVFTLTTTVVALAVGLPIAWLTERTTLRGKAAVYALMTLGLLIPGIFIAMGWTFIAHPRIGFLNTWLHDFFGLGPINIASPAGMGFIQGLSLSALAFILTVQMFRAMDPSLEEAARVHGMGFRKILWRITLPLAAPAILAAVIYIAVIAVASFDVPAVLGLGNRVYMLSTFVYIKTHPPDSSSPEHGITAAVGTFMAIVAVALTWWYSQLLRQGHRYQVITGKGYRPTPVEVGGWGYLGWAFIGLYALVSKVLPLLLVASVAFSPYVAPPSIEMISKFSLANFQKMNWELVWRGLQNTATLVMVVPLLVLISAFCVSWLVVRSRHRARYALEFGAFLPHALPEIMLAIGALLVALFIVPSFLPLYGSIWLIAMVYIVARIAFATRALNSSLLQIHKELEEAAVAAGLSTTRTAWRIVVPLLRPTLLSVWIWTALLVYRELTVAVFLVSHENATLPAVIWSYWFGGGRSEASAVMLLTTALLTPLVLAFWWFGRRSAVETA